MFLFDNEERNTIKAVRNFLRRISDDKDYEEEVHLLNIRIERSFPENVVDIPSGKQSRRLLDLQVNSILRKLYDAGGMLKRSESYTEYVKEFSTLSGVTSWMVENNMIDRITKDKRVYYKLRTKEEK